MRNIDHLIGALVLMAAEDGNVDVVIPPADKQEEVINDTLLNKISCPYLMEEYVPDARCTTETGINVDVTVEGCIECKKAWIMKEATV